MDPDGGQGSPTLWCFGILIIVLESRVKKDTPNSPAKPIVPDPGSPTPGPKGKRATTGSATVALEKFK